MEKNIVSTNRKLKHQYEILENYEAGMSLSGSEVKSLREGEVSIKDSYCRVENGEMFIYNMHVSPYKQSGYYTPNPKRKRKLLLHRKQIERIFGRMTQKGLTVIPEELYFNPGGIAKINICMVKKKQGPDKREKITRKESEREIRERWVSG